MNEEFATSFLNKVNSQVWQTVKAFNARIAGNYESREWSNLRPESEFMGFAQKKIIAFLLNPENIDNEKQIKDKALFVEVISNMMSNCLSMAFKEIAKQAIYTDLREDCWKAGIGKSGAGSTYIRKRIINHNIDEMFNSDNKTDILFNSFKVIVFENELMKNIKYKYI